MVRKFGVRCSRQHCTITQLQCVDGSDSNISPGLSVPMPMSCGSRHDSAANEAAPRLRISANLFLGGLVGQPTGVGTNERRCPLLLSKSRPGTHGVQEFIALSPETEKSRTCRSSRQARTSDVPRKPLELPKFPRTTQRLVQGLRSASDSRSS
jgi:hypothetical protein